MRAQKRRRAGKLRYTITINTVAKTRDGYGDSVDVATGTPNARAEIVTLSSTQGGDDAIDGEDRFMITLRYRSGITTAHTITWGTKTLDIIGVNEDEKPNGWLTLIARERKLG